MSDLTALRRSTLAILTLACVAMAHSVFAAPAGKALILYEPGPTEPLSALGDARQLRQLMGHFRVEPTLLAADVVKPGQLAGYDVTFWLGFSRTPRVPQALIDHLSAADRRVVLIGTGLEGLARHIDLPARFGFEFLRFEPRSPFDTVESGGNRFTKSEPNMQIVKVKDPARCALVATASASSRRGLTTPYILRSGALWVVADSPFSYATESDRYLLFADLLHDILDQDHPRSHSALIRIEDTNPFSNPKQLRAIADLLSARKVPFLVGVTPFYVNPTTGLRVPLSEKPDYVLCADLL
ncbi:MAG: DUF2334 domain-containing protein, partial [Vicinamibacteria bacterium]|nr:DUF2334 domain-containing protein [Vicinamibacteria bacterium]